jgi:hypothetical protein
VRAGFLDVANVACSAVRFFALANVREIVRLSPCYQAHPARCPVRPDCPAMFIGHGLSLAIVPRDSCPL